MLISDWFILIGRTNLFIRGDQAKYRGDQSLRLVPRIQTSLNSEFGTDFGVQNSVPATGFLTKIGLFTRWDLVPGTGPCDRSPRV